jgi:hypothetical protein
MLESTVMSAAEHAWQPGAASDQLCLHAIAVASCALRVIHAAAAPADMWRVVLEVWCGMHGVRYAGVISTHAHHACRSMQGSML